MDLIEEFLNQYNPIEDKQSTTLRDSFVSDYPFERIKNLSIEEYNSKDDMSSFCQRLRYELKLLGSMGGYAYPTETFGICKEIDGSISINKTLGKRYGTDYTAAFLYIKDAIEHLLSAGKNMDYSQIEASGINRLFRFKLLFVYFPESFFPVCTESATKGYCEVFGINTMSSDSMLDMNRALVTWKKQHLPDNWTLHKAMALADWLWRIKKQKAGAINLKDNGKEIAEKIENEIDNLNLVGETREAVVKQRVNQGVFRDRLVKKDKSCRLCKVDDEKLLLASHIKPWKDSLPEERLDPDNGFLMCPNHDRLFDKGLISFDDSGKIMISSTLSQINRTFLNVRDEMSIHLTEGNKKYLEYHRNNIFVK